jgi:hypothetical protein
MLERVILSDLIRKSKAEKKLMMKAEKIAFISDWKLENMKVLEDGVLLDIPLVPLNFFSGIFFSISGQPVFSSPL